MKAANRTLSAPIHVDLMITRRCNLRCLHCSASSEQFVREDMSTDELLSVIDELAACKVFTVCLTGGEPLIHPDFLLFANAVTKHPINLQINTNATLVTPSIVHGLKGLQRELLISVSLDGISSKTHDRIRGPGSFAHMVKGIQTLVNAGFKVRPFVVVSKLNYYEVPDIVKFAGSLGVRQIFLSSPVACGRAKYYQAEMLMKPDVQRRLVEMILAIKDRHASLLRGPWQQMANVYKARQQGQLPKEFLSTGRFTNCPGGRTQAAIASDGTVSPCQMAFMCRAGNVRDKSFVEIWRNSKTLNRIRKSLGIPLADIPGCEDCSWHHICHGPCPADGFNESNAWPSKGALCVRNMCELYDNSVAI